jgi:uncharacterized protein (TIGR03435 family)
MGQAPGPELSLRGGVKYIVAAEMRSSAWSALLALALCGVVFAQTDLPVAAFEVASIRRADGTSFRSGPLTVSSPLIRLRGYTVFGLVMDAYHLRDFQLSFGSAAPKDDIFDAQYDIAARAPGDGVPALDQVRAMLRGLLSERFKLKAHFESKETPVYVLSVAKGGARIEPGSGAGDCAVKSRLAADGRNNEEIFTNCPIVRLADRLGNLIGMRPVLDETGLDGPYNMRFLAVPESRTRNGSNAADVDPITAVRQLGLQLEARKAPIKVLVVDHVERPAEN